jgi:hypothetical protein
MTYYNAVASALNAQPLHRTKLFWIGYDLFGWPFGQLGGAQIAAEGGRRPI